MKSFVTIFFSSKELIVGLFLNIKKNENYKYRPVVIKCSN